MSSPVIQACIICIFLAIAITIAYNAFADVMIIDAQSMFEIYTGMEVTKW